MSERNCSARVAVPLSRRVGRLVLARNRNAINETVAAERFHPTTTIIERDYALLGVACGVVLVENRENYSVPRARPSLIVNIANIVGDVECV